MTSHPIAQVIKFAPPHSTPFPSEPISITATDRSTLSLLASLASLSASIASLEARIVAARSKAVSYAAQKRVELAKAALIEKKREEKLLEERVGQRLKVQEIVAAIERAHGDEEVKGPSFAGYAGGPAAADASFSTAAQTMSALTLGTSTLRSVLSSPALQLDNISELTSALDEQLVAAQEVSEAVDSVSAPEKEALDAEVDEEWKRLVKEEQQKEEQRRVEEAESTLASTAAVPADASPDIAGREGKGEAEVSSVPSASSQERVPAQ